MIIIYDNNLGDNLGDNISGLTIFREIIIDER